MDGIGKGPVGDENGKTENNMGMQTLKSDARIADRAENNAFSNVGRYACMNENQSAEHLTFEDIAEFAALDEWNEKTAAKAAAVTEISEAMKCADAKKEIRMTANRG